MTPTPSSTPGVARRLWQERAGAVAWGLFILSLLLTAGCIVVLFAIGPIEDGARQSEFQDLFPPLLFAAMGALIAAHRPDNPIGWLLITVGIGWCAGSAMGYYALLGFESDPDLPGADLISVVFQVSWVLPLICLPPIFLLFPTGKLVSTRWRAVLWSLLIPCMPVAVMVIKALPHGGPRLLARGESEEIVAGVDTLVAIFILSVAGLLAAAVVSLVVRYRRAGANERAQIKLLIFSGIAVVASAATSNVIPLPMFLSDLISEVAFATIPITIAVAVLRYRLYDIDRLINRTLVYGGLTATLAGLYLFCVFILQQLASPLTQQSDLVVAASTLAVAAAFRPLRTRIQSTIDRRFYRSRYDATATLDSFSAKLREQVDLESLRDELVAVVGATMHPAHASLWLREVRR